VCCGRGSPACGRGLGAPTDFHASASGTDAPRVWGGRFLSSPPSLSHFQLTRPHKSQPIPPQTSPDLEHLPGEGTSQGTEGTGIRLPVSASISFHSSGPALPTSCYSSPNGFLSHVLSFSPLFIGLPPPPPVPPLAFSPWCSLAYSLHCLLPSRLPSWCERG